MRVCSVPGCPTLYDGKNSRCPTCAEAADRRRGTASQRGYTSTGHSAFRAAVLRRDPICVRCRQAAATVADHHPRDRRHLGELGLNPNDPAYGRGLCMPCHGKTTARNQPGGWNRRA